MAELFKASRAMILAVALGVLVGVLIPGVDSLGRSLGGDETQTAESNEGGAIGVLEGPATPSPEPEETETPETTRPWTNTGGSQPTHAPSDDAVVIIATPHPTDDDDDVDEGEEHTNSSSDDDHDTPEPDDEPHDEEAHEEPHETLPPG